MFIRTKANLPSFSLYGIVNHTFAQFKVHISFLKKKKKKHISFLAIFTKKITRFILIIRFDLTVPQTQPPPSLINAYYLLLSHQDFS